MTGVLLWPGAFVCALIVVACICRVNLLNGRSRFGWALLYILWAPFAGGILIDLLRGGEVDWYTCFGIAGVLVHIALTRRLWSHGAPLETRR